MKKRVLYNLGIAFIDFLMFFLICIIAMFIITKDPDYLDSKFLVSSLVISFIKVGLSYAFKVYNMLWMYSIRRNLSKLIIITLSIDLIFFLWNNESIELSRGGIKWLH